jgi:hypothetical protein
MIEHMFDPVNSPRHPLLSVPYAPLEASRRGTNVTLSVGALCGQRLSVASYVVDDVPISEPVSCSAWVT